LPSKPRFGRPYLAINRLLFVARGALLGVVIRWRIKLSDWRSLPLGGRLPPPGSETRLAIAPIASVPAPRTIPTFAAIRPLALFLTNRTFAAHPGLGALRSLNSFAPIAVVAAFFVAPLTRWNVVAKLDADRCRTFWLYDDIEIVINTRPLCLRSA
jgi:hypothetical protein